jgi:hypothetical protein
VAKHLAVGAFSIEYVEDNWRSPLKELGGDSIVTVDYLPLLHYLGVEGASDHLIELIDRHSCASVLIYHDWIKGGFSTRFFESVRARNLPTLAFYPDDEQGDWFEENARKYDGLFDHLATHCHATFELRRARGRTNIHYMPWGYNPSRWHPVGGAEKRHDILFIGKNKGAESSGTGVEDGHFRDRVLERVAALAEQHGFTFSIFGYGWDSHPTLRKYWRGKLEIADAARIVAESRVVLNPGWSVPKGTEAARAQVKLRHFEVLGCRAVQLTNENPELAAVVGDTPLVRYFADAETLERELVAALDRGALDAASRAPLDARHTIAARIAATLESAGIDLVPETPTLVTRLSLDEAGAPLGLEGASPEERRGYFHASRGDLWDLRVDPAHLPRVVGAAPAIHRFVLGLDYARHQANPLHFSDGENALLYTMLDGADAHEVERLTATRLLTPVLLHGARVPLESLLLPGARLESIVAAVREGRDLATAAPVVVHDAYACELVARSEAPVAPREIEARLARLALNTLLKIRDLGRRAAVYGVGGTLGKQVVRGATVAQLDLALVIDNARVGGELGGYTLSGHDALVRNPPDYVLVCAEISGPAIVRQIEADRVPCEVLPLGDLSHPSWASLR